MRPRAPSTCTPTRRRGGDRAAGRVPARRRRRRHGRRPDARAAAPDARLRRPRPRAGGAVPRLRRTRRRAVADRGRRRRAAGHGAADPGQDPRERARGRGRVSPRARLWLGLCSLAGLGALLAWAVLGLPDFGHPRGPYADLAPRIMLSERHVANTVTGVTFDLRGFDTLGEELILFVAALGAAVLLRAQRSERRAERAAEAERRGAGGSSTTDALRALGAV